MVFRVTKAFWLESAGAADSWPGVRERPVQPSDAAGRHGAYPGDPDPDCAPMAAVFFQGTLGTFYSQIGGGAAATPSADGRPPGQYTPAQPSYSSASPNGSDPGRMSSFGSSGGPTSPQVDAGRLGAAR
jgi:type IV secretion system protein VirB6